MFIFAKYFTSGLTAVVVHYLVMVSLVELVSTPPLLGSFAGFVIGTTVNYYLQYNWTFRSTQPHKQALFRYLAITVAMLMLNLLIFQIANQQLGLDYRIAQLFATGIVFLANFTINSRYTFK